MLLIRLLRHDERGAALAGVIGLMATGLLVTALIGGTIVAATGQTTSARAGVQSQASAEAGIAAARAGLIAGTCASQPVLPNGAPVYRSAPGAVPAYAASVWRAGSAGSWTPGCPVGLTTQVRILSTGYAEASGVVGGAGDVTHLEGILSAAATATTILATGPAVYAYNAGSFGNGGSLVSMDGSTPEVIVATGNLTCGNGFSATANLVVNSGDLTVDNGCEISGNAWASGRVRMVNQAEVGGGVIGSGVTMENGATAGRVWSRTDLTMTGNPTISGQAKAFSMSYGGGRIDGAGYIYGTFHGTSNVGGNPFQVGVLAQSITGTIGKQWKVERRNPIVSPTFASDVPPTPLVPDWVDFGSRPEHFTAQAWTGFTVVTLGTNCGSAQVIAAINALAGAPGVLDGRACSGTLVMENNNQASVSADLAIIAPSIRFSNSATLNGVNGPHELWLINPDPQGDGVPTCNGESIVVDGNAKFVDLRTMLYSPCTVTTVSGIEITGQIFAGSASMTNNSELAYAPVGLPGYDLSRGTPTGGSTTTEADRELISLRNVAEGN